MTHEEMLEVAYQRETELTVDDALEELAYIVQGGQDAEEFQQSIRVIAQVLEQYKWLEQHSNYSSLTLDGVNYHQMTSESLKQPRSYNYFIHLTSLSSITVRTNH